MEPEPPAAIDPPANVLLVHAKRCEPAACEALCHDTGATADLRVSFADKRPDRPDPDAVSGRVGLLTVGDVLIEDTAESTADYDETVIDTVRDPTDLSEIGVAVSRFCKHWSDEQLTVCFDSLDALLRHTSPKDVFQFAEEVAELLAAWNDGADGADGGFDFASEPSTEATDEDIARILGK